MHVELEHTFPVAGDTFLVSSRPHQPVAVGIQTINRIVRQASGRARIIDHPDDSTGTLVEHVDTSIVLAYPYPAFLVLRHGMNDVVLSFPMCSQVCPPSVRHRIVHPQTRRAVNPDTTLLIYEQGETAQTSTVHYVILHPLQRHFRPVDANKLSRIIQQQDTSGTLADSRHSRIGEPTDIQGKKFRLLPFLATVKTLPRHRYPRIS